MAQIKSNPSDFLIKKILEELAQIKAGMPNVELKRMEEGMEELKFSFKELKFDLSEMKKKLLDPDDGVIVKVNANTKFRNQHEDLFIDYIKNKAEITGLKKWQSGINKAMWIIFGALVAIVLKVLLNADP